MDLKFAEKIQFYAVFVSCTQNITISKKGRKKPDMMDVIKVIIMIPCYTLKLNSSRCKS